jgi:hypothetical protein
MSDELLDQVARLAPEIEDLSEIAIARQRARLRDTMGATAPPPRDPSRKPAVIQKGSGRNSFWMIAAAGILILVATLSIVLSGSRPPLKRFATKWEPAKSLPVQLAGGESTHKGNSWKLVSYLVQEGWQQNVAGPQAGYLTCANATTCYITANTSTSASGPASYNSIYVSQDSGESWSVLPLPTQTTFTASLSCSSANICAAGALVAGDPAFLSTVDGGHQWTVQPIPAGMNSLIWLSCTSATTCHGVTAPTAVATSGGLAASFGPGGLDQNPSEAFATTDNGGVNWTSTPFSAQDAISAVSCPDESTCIADVYDSSIEGQIPPGIALYSSNGGTTWTNGVLPSGFAGGYLSQVSCGDATHCMVLGSVSVPNPDRCGTPAAAAAGVCSQGSRFYVGGIAASSDGGATWQESTLPSGVPQPQFGDVSCASASECYVTGEEAVPVTIGNVGDADSAMILGTTDAGATWNKVTFSVPPGAPNFDGQSYQLIGDISCPTTTFCLALGVTAQGSPSAPIYRLLATSP